MVSALDSTIDCERDGLSRHTADDRFDAFISYRRKDSAGVAAWLRSRLTQYRPPQALLRRLTPKQKDMFAHSRQFFLDTAYQVANEDFWVNNIEPALRASRYLIVLASAGAFERLADGGENWVEREIRTFVELHGDPSRIILVLPPSGDLQRLPASLAGLSERWDWVDLRAFQAAPWRWLSLRRVQSLETELLEVVARLFEVPRWLIPELTREETRRQARLWTTAATVIGLVVSGVAVAAAVAYQQSQLSQLARALAIINTAQRLSDSGDHASAALVALEALPARSAWLPGPDVPEAQAALFRSLTELRERGVLRGHDGTISELRFTGDGRRVISASRDKTIRVWDAETATELRKLDLDAKPLAVSRLGGTDGPGMAVLDDGKVVEFHTDSSVVRVSATLPAGPWQAAYMSTGDDRVALIGKDEQAGGTSWRVLLADVRSGSIVLDHKLPIEASAFVWSPVEAVAMIGLVDGQILRVVLEKDSAPAPFYKFGKSIRILAFSGDGRRLLAADADGVQVWDGLAGAPLVSLPRGQSSILRATISGNGEFVAVGRWDNCIELWDVTHQRLRHLLNTPCRRDGDYPLQPNMLSFSADASELISASDDRKAVVWNTTSGHPSLVFVGHGDRLERAIADSAGKRFATVSSGVISDRHDIHLWSREAVLSPGILDHGAKVSIDVVAVLRRDNQGATQRQSG